MTLISTTPLARPTIHLNGTSRESLAEGYVLAMSAVADAMRAVLATAPNGRDYYVQPEGALALAQEQHRARMERLRETYNELNEIAEYLTEAM